MEDNGVGIIEFEFTGTADKAAEHYEDLGSDGRSAARTSLLIDYPYLVAYGLFLAGACVAVADRARRAGRSGWPRWGRRWHGARWGRRPATPSRTPRCC